MNVAIIGSGIIGLSCAWRLAQAGCKVSTFDGNRESQEASWTAAGMLAPHNEAKVPDALWSLCSTSLERWPKFVDDLSQSPKELDYHRNGSFIPVFNDSEKLECEPKIKAFAQKGVQIQWLDSHECVSKEPALSNHELLGAYHLDGGHVDPRRVCHVLRERCKSLGVQLHFETHVEHLSEGHITCKGGKPQKFDHVILAAGAWTPSLASITGIKLQGQPVKGQMIRFAPNDGPRLSGFIHCEHAYAVQRQDGSLVIGSTMEYTNFDKRENQTSIEHLVSGARRLMPHLKQVPLSETWTGLRPKLNGGYPLFENVSSKLTIATGHFRNGILLAPVSADIIVDLVLKKSSPLDLSEFELKPI
jgi:glycine oxidase